MEYFHSIQCRDRTTGKTGDFVHNGNFIAISPIFDSLIQLYSWMRHHGWELVPVSRTGIQVRRYANEAKSTREP